MSNTGIFPPQDINELTTYGQWQGLSQRGTLELIQTQTVNDSDYSESILYVDFTNLADYGVHFLVYSDFQGQGYGYPSVRFSNDGGSSFETSGYAYAYWNTAESTVNEGKSGSADTIRLGAIIKELRDRGHKINMEMKYNKTTGSKHGVYSMDV